MAAFSVRTATRNIEMLTDSQPTNDDANSTEISQPGGGWGRLARFRGAGGLCDHLGDAEVVGPAHQPNSIAGR